MDAASCRPAGRARHCLRPRTQASQQQQIVGDGRGAGLPEPLFLIDALQPETLADCVFPPKRGLHLTSSPRPFWDVQMVSVSSSVHPSPPSEFQKHYRLSIWHKPLTYRGQVHRGLFPEQHLAHLRTAPVYDACSLPGASSRH